MDLKDTPHMYPSEFEKETGNTAFDPEKNAVHVQQSERHVSHVDIEIAKARNIQSTFAPFRVLRSAEQWLDKKMGIETIGIDRIPEEEKQPPSIWNTFLMWWSLNVHVGVVPLGLLGPQFRMNLRQSIAAAVIGTGLGALCTANNGTLGPKLGLRTIATARYSFGFWGAKICSILNVVIGCGFAVVNYVVAGEILSAVSDYKMTITVGIVIIAVISFVISLFGFKLIHTFEKYSWIGTFILFCVLIAQAAPYVDPNAPGFDTGLPLAGSFLSILAINFSNASGWCSMASDYYCNYPASTPYWKIFFLTWFGVLIPTSFSVIIGSCLGVPVALTKTEPLYDAYNSHGLGGLIYTIYHPKGWSKFALVLLTFSVLGNNIAINYSSGLSIQLLGHYFHAVPRMIWSLLVAIVITVLAIAGQQNLSNYISDFVSLLGYWTISFTIILILEDRWFRRRDGYDLTVWDSPRGLPIGASAVLALLAGYCAGGVPGMAQTWYVGPIARKFSQYGGDVGVYMSGAITLLIYPIARTFEKRYFGR